jgi:hypothetical protein
MEYETAPAFQGGSEILVAQLRSYTQGRQYGNAVIKPYSGMSFPYLLIG